MAKPKKKGVLQKLADRMLGRTDHVVTVEVVAKMPGAPPVVTRETATVALTATEANHIVTHNDWAARKCACGRIFAANAQWRCKACGRNRKGIAQA